MILTDEQVDDIRADYVAETMFDTCQVGPPTGGGFGSKDPVPSSYTYGTAGPCGVKETDAREVVNGSQAVLVDAVIRIPNTVSVVVGSRIQVTHRHGKALATPEVYAVHGLSLNGIGFMRCNCSRITGKSTK